MTTSSDATGMTPETRLRLRLMLVGIGVGAAVGLVGYLARLDSGALVPLCAGAGCGVGSGVGWLIAARKEPGDRVR